MYGSVGLCLYHYRHCQEQGEIASNILSHSARHEYLRWLYQYCARLVYVAHASRHPWRQVCYRDNLDMQLSRFLHTIGDWGTNV